MNVNTEDIRNQLAGNKSGTAELRSRLLFVMFALLVYRVGTHIPVPGIDPAQLQALFNQNQGGILELFNMFSGGAWERMSILALGVIPYITASIIMNLLTMMYPTFMQWKKEGDAGRRKITRVTRYLTLGIALIQSFSLTVTLANQGLAFQSGPSFYFVSVVTLVTGSIFMMWLGEQITERGVGNGISLLIFAGIVSGFPAAIGQVFEAARQGNINVIALLAIAALAVGVVWFVVRVERGQRRLSVNYAKRQQGRRVYQGQSSHLPLKINMAGVIPAIFASALLLLPVTFSNFDVSDNETFLNLSSYFTQGQPLYMLLYASGIIFFTFFYTSITFNPTETAENLRKYGGFVPGIRPGESTAMYIENISTKLTTIGALYLTLVCLMPEFLIANYPIPFYLGGASILIVVVVAIDTVTQIQTRLMSSQYEQLIKKTKFGK